jgi:arylsulfatase A-like enzyme/Tfp pilus assembly protein PilF
MPERSNGMRTRSVFLIRSEHPGSREKKRLLSIITLSLFFLAYFSPLSFPSEKVRLSPENEGSRERFNLLVITIDTLRADRLSCYNPGQAKTPNIDTLADEGVVFTRAFAHTSTTLASHTNILLGTTPLYHGIHDNLNFKVRDEDLTLAEHLKQGGYATGAFLGAFPLDSRFGLSQGFDTYDDGDFWSAGSGDAVSAERPAGVVVDRALDWLDGRDSPWFAWVHCFDPHHPYEPPEPFRAEYKDIPYNGEVAYVDHEIGRLFAYLKNNRLQENTIIVFTADHGESLGEHGEETHGCFAYNSTIWIPLIINVPGSKHRIVRQEVSHIDIFPTVCDVLKFEKPAILQGTSLIPCMEGKKLEGRTIYFESLSPYYNFGWAPIRGIIQDGQKFIDSPIPELYDLEKDFDESNDMALKSNLDAFREMLDQVIQSQESSESLEAEKGLDKDTLEKLKSLGYVGNFPGERKRKFSIEDDAKVLLPYHYKSEKALELKDEGKVREGIEMLKEVITEKKNVAKAYSNLAAIYSSLGRLDDAIQVLGMGLEFIPESYTIFSGYMGYLSEAQRWDDMISFFNGATFRQLDFDPYVWDLAGQAYLHKGDIEEALSFCEKAVAIDENYAVAFSNLGIIHIKFFDLTRNSEELSKAFLNYEKALELDPRNCSAHQGLGLLHMYRGNNSKAIYHLEFALQLQPDMHHVFYNLGIANLRYGNMDRALFYFNEFKNSPSYSVFSTQEKEILERNIAECKDRLENKAPV